MTNPQYTKPAPYPSTDHAEVVSVHCVEGKLNKLGVKHHLGKRDKVPNHDGTIELTDSENRPTGSCCVQIKTIPTGEKKYSCEIELIAYSKVITVPFILFCVDAANEVVYWRQLTEDMPEFKPEQQTFTIHFSEADLVDDAGNCAGRWRQTCQDYQQRIQEFPRLKAEKDANKICHNLTTEQVSMFQEMSDTINLALDTQWTILKSRFFPDTWKIGIGVESAEDQKIKYQLFSIPYGKSGLLVKEVEKAMLDIENTGGNKQNSFMVTGTNKWWFKSGKHSGKEFVSSYAKRAATEYQLQVCGKFLATEIVCAFIRHYFDCLAVEPAVRYETPIIREKIYNRFFNWKWLHENSLRRKFTFGYMYNRPFVSRPNPLIRGSYPTDEWPREIGKFLLSAVREAIDWLYANQVHEIIDTMPPPDILDAPPIPLFQYSNHGERQLAAYLLEDAVSVYTEFLSGNGLLFLPSRHLDTRSASVFSYAPRFNRESGQNRRYMPPINEMVFDNTGGQLKKNIVLYFDDANKIPQMHDYEFDGHKHRFRAYHSRVGDIIYSSMPHYALCYCWLRQDIEEYFKHGDVPAQHPA